MAVTTALTATPSLACVDLPRPPPTSLHPQPPGSHACHLRDNTLNGSRGRATVPPLSPQVHGLDTFPPHLTGGETEAPLGSR
jgi:hypothetical protein